MTTEASHAQAREEAQGVLTTEVEWGIPTSHEFTAALGSAAGALLEPEVFESIAAKLGYVKLDGVEFVLRRGGTTYPQSFTAEAEARECAKGWPARSVQPRVFQRQVGAFTEVVADAEQG